MLRTIYKRLRRFQEVLALVIFYIGWGFNPLHPDLLVTYSEDPYFIPLGQSASASGEADNQKLITIVLSNKGSATVDRIELKVNGVRRVLLSGARSSFSRFDPEAARVLKPLKDPQTFYFDGVKEIPPGHNVQIQLVAETYQLFLGPRITITSDAKETRVYATSQTTGIFVFLDDHWEFLVAFSFIVAILIGARRLVRVSPSNELPAGGGV